MNHGIAKRDLSFDIARALSALWVVGVWHLFCYDNNMTYAHWTTQQITDVFLSVFMFISGYMLGKYRFGKWNDIKVFYKKRLWRFYILYIVASITLYVGGALIGNQMYASTEQIVLSFLGLNVLFPPHLGTLWFISMIMFFYLITPLLSFKWKSRVGNYTAAIIIYLFFFLWRELIGYIESYVFLMFPMYALGLILPRKITNMVKGNWAMVIVGLVLFVSLSQTVQVLSHLKLLSLFFNLICLLGGVLFVLGVSEQLACVVFARKVFAWVAYSSLCAYLFHRQVYSVMHSVMKSFGVSINIAMLWLLFLPAALICAYLIQKIYDGLLSKYMSNL